MGRVHLFEFEDQPWFPGWLRDYMTDYLQTIVARFDPYTPIIPLVSAQLDAAGTNKIIDVCSGGSGPLVWLQNAMEAERGSPVHVTMTDKYPNLPAFERVKTQSNGKIDYISESVDATDIPEDMDGLRTIFAGFHHFDKDLAHKILADAAHKKRPIAIFEITERSAPSFISILFVPLFVLLLTPFIRPFRLGRILFTYLIPIVPALIAWDGFVSCLRTYSIDEMNDLTKDLSDGYTWTPGQLALEKGPGRITYLLGKPEP